MAEPDARERIPTAEADASPKRTRRSASLPLKSSVGTGSRRSVSASLSVGPLNRARGATFANGRKFHVELSFCAGSFTQRGNCACAAYSHRSVYGPVGRSLPKISAPGMRVPRVRFSHASDLPLNRIGLTGSRRHQMALPGKNKEMQRRKLLTLHLLPSMDAARIQLLKIHLFLPFLSRDNASTFRQNS